MKKLFKIILGATVGSTLLLSSCNFLDVDPYFEATFKEDSIFHSKKNAEGYLWNTPKGFPDAGRQKPDPQTYRTPPPKRLRRKGSPRKRSSRTADTT